MCTDSTLASDICIALIITILEVLFVSLVQNGDISYHLHKVRTFSPFAASEWQLSDGSKTSPGTIIIRKSPFAGHVTFERRDGTLIADMGPRLLMTGSEFCWGGKVYRYQNCANIPRQWTALRLLSPC